MITPELLELASVSKDWLYLVEHSSHALGVLSPRKVDSTECPYMGVSFRDVPDYEEGYGCPVCGAIGASHLDTAVISTELLVAAFKAAFEAGRKSVEQGAA